MVATARRIADFTTGPDCTRISQMHVLLTGGAGYVGSHTAVELLAEGHEVGVLDNLENAFPCALDAVRAISGRDVSFLRGDIRDADCLDAAFRARPVDAVLHFAALKAAGESVADPLRYYDTNVVGTLRLVERMAAHGVKTLVFSSSAAVYGSAGKAPLLEDAPTVPRSPYGRSKLMAEDILRDLHVADPTWRISILRYFNAAGTHRSGNMKETPRSAHGNLLHAVGSVAAGLRPRLDIFGGDYPTPDGTAVRDYLHVVDLARAHVKALRFLEGRPRISVHNLGTGHGRSVLEVVRTFEAVSGRTIPRRIVARRPGDVAICRANATLAGQELDWRPERALRTICTDLWRALSRRSPDSER